LVGEDKMYLEQNQVPMQASVVWDIVAQELFDGRSPPDVIWDADQVHHF
jgi:hypothetical protein